MTEILKVLIKLGFKFPIINGCPQHKHTYCETVNFILLFVSKENAVQNPK